MACTETVRRERCGACQVAGAGPQLGPILHLLEVRAESWDACEDCHYCEPVPSCAKRMKFNHEAAHALGRDSAVPAVNTLSSDLACHHTSACRSTPHPVRDPSAVRSPVKQKLFTARGRAHRTSGSGARARCGPHARH